jgi:hypothetical protein
MAAQWKPMRVPQFWQTRGVTETNLPSGENTLAPQVGHASIVRT